MIFAPARIIILSPSANIICIGTLFSQISFYMFKCFYSCLAFAVMHVICSYARLLHISLNYVGFLDLEVRKYSSYKAMTMGPYQSFHVCSLQSVIKSGDGCLVWCPRINQVHYEAHVDTNHLLHNSKECSSQSQLLSWITW